MKLKELNNKKEEAEEQREKYRKLSLEYVKNYQFSGEEILEIAQKIAEYSWGLKADMLEYFYKELTASIEKKEDIKK